jgi:glycosyltransferase involved in cell wall biosynthesis
MRILYSHRIQSRDGQSVHVEELIHAFRSAGHEVLVVGPSFYAASAFGGESRIVAALRRFLPGALGELAELAYNLPAWWRLRRAARAFQPDFIYERCNLYFLAGALVSRGIGLPLFLEVNSPLAEERARFGGLRLHRLAAALERWTWRSATRILPVTRVLGDRLVAAGVAPDRVRVVPNGVVLDRFPPRRVSSADASVLGFVGFVRPWHGLDAVIDALASEPAARDTSLVIVGDGPALPALQGHAAALGVADRVRFTGLALLWHLPA